DILSSRVARRVTSGQGSRQVAHLGAHQTACQVACLGAHRSARLEPARELVGQLAWELALSSFRSSLVSSPR
ncbi:hypothetical protein KI387_035050, partial [Taxus chinensis]